MTRHCVIGKMIVRVYLLNLRIHSPWNWEIFLDWNPSWIHIIYTYLRKCCSTFFREWISEMLYNFWRVHKEARNRYHSPLSHLRLIEYSQDFFPTYFRLLLPPSFKNILEIIHNKIPETMVVLLFKKPARKKILNRFSDSMVLSAFLLVVGKF